MYWVRRVLVLAAAAIALVLVIAIVVNLNSAANATGPEAVPAPAADVSSTPPPTSTAPAIVATPSGEPSGARSSSVAASPAPALSSAQIASPGGASGSAKPSSSGTSSSGSSSGTKDAAKPPAKGSPAEVAACNPAQLRPTLTGPQNVKVKAKANLDLSLINGGATTCQLRLTPANFVLTIYSGKDRIWSTADCADLVRPTLVKIAREDAYEWRIVWDGRRSKKSCQTRPEIPRAGTYVATAQFTGADPVKFRMFLHT